MFAIVEGRADIAQWREVFGVALHDLDRAHRMLAGVPASIAARNAVAAWLGAFDALHSGDPSQAGEAIDTAIVDAERSGDDYVLGRVLATAAGVLGRSGDADGALAAVDRAATLLTGDDLVPVLVNRASRSPVIFSSSRSHTKEPVKVSSSPAKAMPVRLRATSKRRVRIKHRVMLFFSLWV